MILSGVLGTLVAIIVRTLADVEMAIFLVSVLMKARHALVGTNIKQSEGGRTTGMLANVGARNQDPVGLALPGSAKKKNTGGGVYSKSKNKKEWHHEAKQRAKEKVAKEKEIQSQGNKDMKTIGRLREK